MITFILICIIQEEYSDIYIGPFLLGHLKKPIPSEVA